MRILLLAFILSPALSLAQVVGGMNLKMETMWDKEKYEDIAYKGEGWVDSDKYKKDPEIYLYVSMAWYEISQINDPKMKEEYPKSLDYAMKWASKFHRKDKDGVMREDNDDYFSDLAKAGISFAAEKLEQPRGIRKAIGMYKYMTRAMPDDHNILYAKGVLEMQNFNEGQAERDISMAMTGLAAKYAKPGYKPVKATKGILEDSMIKLSDLLVEKSMKDSANKVLNWAATWFPDSEKLKTKMGVTEE